MKVGIFDYLALTFDPESWNWRQRAAFVLLKTHRLIFIFSAKCRRICACVLSDKKPRYAQCHSIYNYRHYIDFKLKAIANWILTKCSSIEIHKGALVFVWPLSNYR